MLCFITCMIWEIHLGYFLTHSLRCERVVSILEGVWGVIHMSLVFYMFQTILNIFVFCLFWPEKIKILMEGSYSPPPCGKFRKNNQSNFLTHPLLAYFLTYCLFTYLLVYSFSCLPVYLSICLLVYLFP